MRVACSVEIWAVLSQCLACTYQDLLRSFGESHPRIAWSGTQALAHQPI